MRKLHHLLLMAALVLAMHAHCQVIMTDLAEKIIMPDSLNLPRNTSASTIITMLPELLQRPGDYILSNYDIQIEYMSLGSTADVALNDLQIADIQTIIISDSPMANYEMNGQGGSINIILRSSAPDNRNLWGSVTAAASSETDVAPQFSIGYKKDKLLVRGIVLGEMYNPSHDVHTQSFQDGQFLSQSFTTTDTRFYTGMARAYLQYNLTSNDLMKLNISGTHSYNKYETVTNHDSENALTNKSTSDNIHAQFWYMHNTAKSNFTLMLDYLHAPYDNKYDVFQGHKAYLFDGSSKANRYTGVAEYRTELFSKTSSKGNLNQGHITFGCNVTKNSNDQHASISDKVLTIFSPAQTTLEPQNDIFLLMPYVILEGKFGKFRFNAAGEFQHYKDEMKNLSTPYSRTRDNFTGRFISEWHFTEPRFLRFSLTRNLERPSTAQLYPHTLFDPNRMEYVKGNPTLQPMISHKATLEYIGYYKLNAKQALNVDAGVSFNNVSDIINNVYPKQNVIPGAVDMQQRFLSFENAGSSKIMNANFMALYSNNLFSLSLVGNVYHQMLDTPENDNHYTYYNIAVHPYFNFKDGWHGGARLVYYSRIDTGNGSIGDCALADMTVGKAWKHFFVFLTERTSLRQNCKDITRTDNIRTERLYQLIDNYLAIGVKYSF